AAAPAEARRRVENVGERLGGARVPRKRRRSRRIALHLGEKARSVREREPAAADVDRVWAGLGRAPGARRAVEDDETRDRLVLPRRQLVGERGPLAEAGEVELARVDAAHEGRRPGGVVDEQVGGPATELVEIRGRRVRRDGVGAVVEPPDAHAGGGEIDAEVVSRLPDRQLAVHVHAGEIEDDRAVRVLTGGEAVEPGAVETTAGRPCARPHVLAEERTLELADRLHVGAGACRPVGTRPAACEPCDEDGEERGAAERHSPRRNSMNFSAAGEKCLPWRWMMPSGRSGTSSENWTATRVFPFTSGRTAGSGRIASPVPISTTRLIVSTLSSSITQRA